MNEIKRYKAVAAGRVQGVGFRIFVVNNASELGVTGWVKNMPDGTVNMEMQGAPEALTKLAEIIKKGNFIIKTDTFECEEIPCAADEKTFIIKY